jgi:two-component system, sensor histidine kinase
MRRMPWVHALLVLCMAAFMHPYVDPAVFAGWGLLSVLVETARARYSARVARRGFQIDPTRAHTSLVVQAMAAGAVIGAGAILFLPGLPIAEQALYGGILFAIPAAGTVVSQSSRYMVAAYAVSILLPASVTWMFLHPQHSAALSGLTILYCVVLVTAAADGDKLLARSVAIRHERDQLIRDLEKSNAEVRTAVARAEESAQARARVLAAASHDLRQPLHALSVYSAVLATNPAPEAMGELAANIDQIVRSLGSLLHGLLDLSRISAGHYVLERRPIALDGVVASVCGEFARTAAGKGIDLHWDLSPVRVLGDALALGRIARNLLDNALKYTERGSVKVEVGTDQSANEPQAILSVADSGKGIPAQELGRIFEEFYQLDNPGRDRSKGVGLGLAIVQRLCELSGARITVSSEVGRGTIFRVHLPLATGEPDAAGAEQPPADRLSLRGVRIYVADDEADINRSMHHLLAAWGACAATADSRESAERLFDQQGPPDLFITDLRLGEGESGAAFAARMRQKYGDFPVLVITGETAAAALEAAQRQGFALAFKPITAERLREAMLALLRSAANALPVR